MNSPRCPLHGLIAAAISSDIKTMRHCRLGHTWLPEDDLVLKPCRRCKGQGDPVIRHTQINYVKRYAIFCTKCEMSTLFKETMRDCIAMWNSTAVDHETN